MMRWILACVILQAATVWAEADERVQTKRELVREPKYAEAPRYAIVSVGAKSNTSVWLVLDGKRLYIDRNGNGDLTDDGYPIQASDERSFQQEKGKAWDRSYKLDAWSQPDESRVTEFELKSWNYNDADDQYGISLKVNGEVPMYAGWYASLPKSAAEAPVMHFGAPVVVLPLRNKQLMLNTPIQRFSIHFTTPKKTGQAATRLSIDALPETAHPVIQIDWPVKKGTKPLSSSHILNERCCYWEFYTTKFAIPERAVPGTAKITVSVPDAAFPLELACDNFEMPVVAETSQTPGD